MIADQLPIDTETTVTPLRPELAGLAESLGFTTRFIVTGERDKMTYHYSAPADRGLCLLLLHDCFFIGRPAGVWTDEAPRHVRASYQPGHDPRDPGPPLPPVWREPRPLADGWCMAATDASQGFYTKSRCEGDVEFSTATITITHVQSSLALRFPHPLIGKHDDPQRRTARFPATPAGLAIATQVRDSWLGLRGIDWTASAEQLSKLDGVKGKLQARLTAAVPSKVSPALAKLERAQATAYRKGLLELNWIDTVRGAGPKVQVEHVKTLVQSRFFWIGQTREPVTKKAPEA